MKLHYPQGVPVYYCADLHLGHGNIMLYCGRSEYMTAQDREMSDAWYTEGFGFVKRHDKKPRMSRESVSKHDEGILANINTTVPADGILVVVGDFCWGRDDISVARRYRDAIRCKNIHLIFGNHDDPKIGELFRWADQKITLVIPGHDTSKWRRASDVVVDHEVHWIWDGRHKGARHYYGHSHSMAEEELDRLAPGRFSQDVGIDNAKKLTGEYRPFSDVELEVTMSERSGFGVYHHDGWNGIKGAS